MYAGVLRGQEALTNISLPGGIPGRILFPVQVSQGVHDGAYLVHLCDRVLPPLRAPDPVYPPSSGLQVVLAVEVPLPGGGGAVVQLAVAFDAQYVFSILADGQVYPVFSDADLRVHLQASGREGVVDLVLEVAVELEVPRGAGVPEGRQQGFGRSGVARADGAGVLQVALQQLRPVVLGSADIQVLGVEGHHHVHLLLGPADGDVEAVLAALLPQPSEVADQPAALVLRVSDREDDDVPLVSLDEYYRSNGFHQNETDSTAHSGEYLCVEGACDYTRKIMGHNTFLGGINVPDYAGNPEQFRKAVRMNLTKSDGLMIFDMVHLVNYGWWDELTDAIRFKD